MSEHEELQVGTQSLAELLAEAGAHSDDRPVAGGEYDTKEGWRKRLHVGQESLDRLLDLLEKRGQAKSNVRGVIIRAGHRYSKQLIYSPELKRLADEATSA